MLTLLLLAAALAGPHADALRAIQAGRLPPPRRGQAPPPPPPTDGPDATVYGYWPYWGDSLDTIAWDPLSHLAIFGVELAADGSLTHTSRWTDVAEQAVAYGRQYDVRVHLCLIAFDSDVHAAVLPSQERRARLVSELSAQVEAYGADGVNLDVEGMSSAHKQDLVALTRELKAAVGEVVHATPAVDWAGAYDYDELAEASDGLFIMAYGYHWDGGDPGPLAPLRGGSPWSDYSIAWSVDDYRAFGATDDRIIIGLPLYGDDWPTTDTSVPGTATDDADSVTWVEALAQAEVTGRHWDDVTSTPYTFPSATHQLWYDDFYSLEEKISWSVGEGLQGVGFWALTYEDGDARLWDRVRDLTTTNSRDTDDETPDSDDGGDSPPGSRGRGLGEGCGCAAPGPHGVGLLAVIVGWALPRRRWRQ